MTRPAMADAIARFGERCRDAIRWRRNLFRERRAEWRAARKAGRAINQLSRMKAANPGRPFCGIILIEHIGDIVACEPIIERVRTAHPEAFVVWVMNRQYASLLSAHPGLDAILFVDSLLSVEHIIAAGVFDFTYDLHVNRKPTEIPGRRYKKQTGDPTIDVTSYMVNGSLLRSFSIAAGVEPRAAAPTMYVPNKIVRAIDRLALPEQFVVVHATPNYGDKDWSPSRWRELIRYILDHYETHVIEIGLESVIDLDDRRFTSLCGRLSIIETAELIRRSAFFVGVDSGPAHIANAWRRPALLLLGRFVGSDSFNPFDGYYGEMAGTVILRYPGPLRDQTVGAVIAVLEASRLWRESVGQRGRPGEANSVERAGTTHPG